MKFVSRLLKRWYLYLFILLVLPVGATLYGRTRLSSYQSYAYLYVSHASYLDSLSSEDYNTYLTPAQNEASFMTELMASQTFMVQVAKQTDLAHVYDLTSTAGQQAAAARVAEDIVLTPSSTGPNGLTIVVKDKEAALTQQLAKALISQFIAYDAQRQVKADDDALAFYQKQLDTAKADAADDGLKLTNYLKDHPNLSTTAAQQNDSTFLSLQSQLKQDQDTVASLQTTLKSIQLDKAAAQDGSSNNLNQLDSPSAPQKAPVDSKQLIFYAVLGLLAALILIALIVGIPTLLDSKVQSSDDLQTIFDEMNWDVPIIETVPVMQQKGNGRSRSANNSTALVALLAPPSEGEGEIE